jgi:hypothetical protein
MAVDTLSTPPEVADDPEAGEAYEANHTVDLETREWIEAFDDVFSVEGRRRAAALLSALTDRAHQHGVDLPFSANTPYVNTIPRSEQPPYPGDRKLERRIKSLIRWNSMAMVVQANKRSEGIGRGRAPGLKRPFGFEKLDNFNGTLWKSLREEAAQPAAKAPKLTLFGSDSDAAALTAARRNLGAAGVERWVTLEASDVLSRKAPADSGVMIANPPYGERIGESEELMRFYPKLGDALKQNFAGWNCFFFTADRRMEKLIRLQTARRTPLYNGALECRLYEFRIVAGSHR